MVKAVSIGALAGIALAQTPTPTPTPSTTLVTSTTSSAPGSDPTGDGLKWLGVDESVAEFGDGIFPGVWGKDFYFPDESAIDTLIADGYNVFRVPFSMERMTTGESLSEPLAEDYLANYTKTIDHITSSGAWAVLDPHNYGRFYGEIIEDTAAFGDFWTSLATAFSSYDQVIFDTNNEYHEMDQDLVLNLNQAAIDAIRGAGATSQYIFVEGNSWSGAWTWRDVNDNLSALTDPQDMIVYEMHQYLDEDGSGTHEECVSSTIGGERVADATAWLRENNKIGIIGEFAGGPNDVCADAVTSLLEALEENNDVWMGALWWAAGPWWADYMYSFEPPSGTAYTYYNSLLREFAP